MLNFHIKSFANRISLYVLSFTLLIFILVFSLFYTISRKRITDHAIDHTHGQLQNMSTQVNSLLQTVETTLDQSVWMIEGLLNQPDSLYKVIDAVVKTNDLIVGSGIAFEPNYYKNKGKYFMPYATLQKGKMVYRTLGGYDYDYPCMDWYFIPKTLKQTYWSEPYFDDGGGDIIMTSFSKPLFDKEGNVYAIFTANISLSQFTNMVNELKPYTSSFTFLLSRNGSYLTNPDSTKIMNETIFTDAWGSNKPGLETVGYEMLGGKTGTNDINLNNEPVWVFYTTIPNSGWSIGNVCPDHIITGDLDKLSKQIVLLFICGILLLFFINNAIIRKIVYPLKAFSLSARDIATGRFDVKLYEVHSHDEIKDLHDSLAYMQNSLSEYVTELRLTTATKERIESELSIAREIQLGMIPKIFPPFPERKDVDLYAVLHSAKEVGGDLYDFFIDSNRLYFIIGDVSGKGVPASLFMAIARSLFRTLSPQATSPATVVTEMNNSVSENNESNMFVTLIMGILDLQTGLLKLCNAGHNPLLFMQPNGTVSFLELKKNLFAGIMPNFQYEEDEVQLEKGTKLFLYTDGATEAENSAKELYGEERLKDILSAKHSDDVRSIVNTVISSIHEHVQEAEVSDDLTLLVIHYEPQSNK